MFEEYIGRTYEEMGDCWGLVRKIYKRALDVSLSPAPSPDGWEEVDKPKKLDVVLLRQFRVPGHVGVMMDDECFVHCEKGIGTVKQSIKKGRWATRIEKFYRLKKSVQVVSMPKMFSDVRIVTHAYPNTLSTIIEEAIGKKWMGCAVVTVHGQHVKRKHWENTLVKPGAIVTVKLVPRGGGKSILRSVLTIAVMGWASGLHFSMFGSQAIGRAFAGAAGLMLVNALVPPPRPHFHDETTVSNVYSITGASNQIKRYGAVPVVLGEHRFRPPFAAKPYTMVQGDDQYLCCLFAIGYGPLSLSESDMKIGDTSLTSFSDYEIEIREGTAADADITLFPENVSETVLSIDLTSSGGWQTRTTEIDTDQAIVDITFPRGLIQYSKKGGTSKKSVLLEVEKSATGAGSWSNAVGQHVSSVAITTAGTSYKGGWWELDVSGGGGTGASARARVIAGRVSRVEILKYGEGYTSVPTFTMPTAASGSGATFTATMADGLKFYRATDKPFRHSSVVTFASRGQYDVRIRRVTADSASSLIADTTQWSAIRSVKNEAPINTSYHLAKVALKIKASGQLNGTIQDFSVLAKSRCKEWSGSAWVANQETNNPADLFRYVLQHPAFNKAVADSRIDLATLQTWSEFCDTKSFACNIVLDSRKTIKEILSLICKTGRANLTISDNKFSVVIEDAQTTPVQLFTPRNVMAFSGQRTYINTPHALRCRFANEDNDYLMEERIVYASGYDSSTATDFENWDMPGVTDADQVWKLAKYYLAVAENRQETFTLHVDAEHLVCTKGDLVRFLHDVPLIGISSGRVVEVNADWIRVDENCPMESGKTYAVQVLKSDGTMCDRAVTLSEGDNKVLMRSGGSAFDCAVGDKFAFGETSSESLDCLVLDIQHSKDLSAQLTLIPYASAVYTADSGSIPAYTAQMTLPEELRPPPAPSSLSSNEFLYKDDAGVLKQGVTIHWMLSSGVDTVDKFDVEVKRDDTEMWEHLTTVTITQATHYDVATGTYDYRIRSWRGLRASDWAELEDVEVDAWDDVPDDIENLRLVYRAGVPWLVWDEVDDPRPVEYEVRMSTISGADWDRSEVVSTLSVTEYALKTSGLFYVKAKYRSAYSEHASFAFNPFSNLDSINVKKTKTEQITWGGTTDLIPAPPLYGTWDYRYRYRKHSFNPDTDWDHEYDCSTDPVADGWTETVGASGDHKIEDGYLKCLNGVGAQGYYNIYRDYGASPSYFEVAEMRFKLVADSDGNYPTGYFQITNQTTGTQTKILFEHDRIIFHDNHEREYTCDLSLWHTVKIVLGEMSYIYLDEELIYHAPIVGAGGVDRIYAGLIRQAAGTGEMWIDYINYGDAPVSSTQTMTADGWTADTGVTASSSDLTLIKATSTGKKGLYQIPSGTLTNDSMIVSAGVGGPEDASKDDKAWLMLFNKDSGYNVSVSIESLGKTWKIEKQAYGSWQSVDSGSLPLERFLTNNLPIATLILYGSKYYFIYNDELLSSGDLGTSGLGSLANNYVYVGVDGTTLTGVPLACDQYLTDIAYSVTTGLPHGLQAVRSSSGTYQIDTSDIVDLGRDAEVLIDSKMAVLAYGIYDLLGVQDLLLEPDLLHGGNSFAIPSGAVQQKIRVYSDINSAWDDWTPLVPGSYYGRKFDLKVDVEAGELSKINLVGWQWEVDMPDTIESHTTTSSSFAAVTVSFSNTYQTTPKVTGSIIDAQSGDHLEITNTTTMQVEVSVYNSGSRVARTVNLVVIGY